MLNIKSTVAIMAMLPLGLLAQKDVVSAYNANQDGDYLKAAEFIDQAILDDKANVKEKTWRYRGDIYLNIGGDSSLFAIRPDALKVAMDSYLKAAEFDEKGKYSKERSERMDRVALVTQIYGGNAYNEGDYPTAAGLFLDAAAFGRVLNRTDSAMYFNSALCYDLAQMYDEAVEQYLVCGMIGYQVPDVYTRAAQAQKAKGDTAAALVILQEARLDYPREQQLIIDELNIYLMAGEFERAKENLTLAAEQDSTNEIIWFSLGSVYDNLGMTDEAVEAYGKSLDIQPNYFDANFNLGALYFNQAVKMVNDANDMWKPRMSKSEATKQKELEDGGKAMFSTALPYLEKALLENPFDSATIRSLRDIYARTGNDEAFLSMRNRLKDLDSWPARMQGCESIQDEIERSNCFCSLADEIQVAIGSDSEGLATKMKAYQRAFSACFQGE